jgi:hypothetical protein
MVIVRLVIVVAIGAISSQKARESQHSAEDGK